MTPFIKESWSVKEVASELGVSKRLVTRWLKEKRLLGQKQGKAWIVFECRKPLRKVKDEHKSPYWNLIVYCPYCGFEETVLMRRKFNLVKAKEVIEYKGNLYHIRRCGPLKFKPLNDEKEVKSS